MSGGAPRRNNSTRATSATPAARAAKREIRRSRGLISSATPHRSAQGGPRERGLGDEARGAALREAFTVVLAVADGGEYDRGDPRLPEPLGNLESVGSGQLHVQQHDVRVERTRSAEGGDAVGRLTDGLEAVQGEPATGQRTEHRIVVDDQDGGRPHAPWSPPPLRR